MVLALFVPVVLGLFLLAMGWFEARLFSGTAPGPVGRDGDGHRAESGR
jgi:hypothetical protein